MYRKQPASSAARSFQCTAMSMQVLVVIFGQELPEATASLASQIFGLCVALVGLATFALVLALLQQVRHCAALHRTELPVSRC